MTNAKIKGMIAAMALAGLSGTVHASPLLNEPFDQYANGTTLDSTGNWTFFSPTSNPTLPYTVNNGTVTATNLASGVSGEDDKNTFSTTPITTGILYYSALLTVPTGTTVTSSTGDYFFAPYSSAAGNYAARVYVSQGSAAGTVAFGLTTAAANGTTNPVNKTADLTLGTEYKLVLRYDVAAKTATLGLFAPGDAVTADSQLTITSGLAGAIASVDSVAIRQGSSAAFSVVIDGLQVGTALADVSAIATGSSTYFNAAVPEPSAYLLSLCGIIGLGAVLRRNRHVA